MGDNRRQEQSREEKRGERQGRREEHSTATLRSCTRAYAAVFFVITSLRLGGPAVNVMTDSGGSSCRKTKKNANTRNIGENVRKGVQRSRDAYRKRRTYHGNMASEFNPLSRLRQNEKQTISQREHHTKIKRGPYTESGKSSPLKSSTLYAGTYPHLFRSQSQIESSANCCDDDCRLETRQALRIGSNTKHSKHDCERRLKFDKFREPSHAT